MRVVALIAILLLTGCATAGQPLVDEAKMGFVCERVYKKEVKPPTTTDTEQRRELDLPKSRVKCSGKRLFWFRVKFNT